MESKEHMQGAGSSDSQVFLQDLLTSRAEVGSDPSGARSDSVMFRTVVRELARLGHQSLVGSGLRTQEIGAAMVCAGPHLPLRSSNLAEAVVDQLRLHNTHFLGFGGSLSLYQALFFASTAIRARHFSHVLVLHVASSDQAGKAQFDLHATLVGRTPGRVQYLGLAFGNLPQDPSTQPVTGELWSRLRLGGEVPQRVVWSRDSSDQGAAGLARFMVGSRVQERAVIGALDKGRWAGAVFEAGPRDLGQVQFPDESIQGQLRRAVVGEFPVSLVRISLETGPEVKIPRATLLEEVKKRVKSTLRAFDDVRSLKDDSLLAVLPRAGGPDMTLIRARLMTALNELDPAGELSFEPKLYSITIEPERPSGLNEISRALQVELP